MHRAAAAGSPPLNQLDSWIAIAADGSVTAYSGKEELGQGISTAQTQLVAEELCVPFNRVKLIYCDTALTPDQAHTSGSQSHPTNFNHGNLAQACATAREALFSAGVASGSACPSISWPPPTASISVKSDPSKKVSYGELIGGKKFNLTLDHQGQAQRSQRVDCARKTDRAPRSARDGRPGNSSLCITCACPGMLHGRVVRPPAVGATVVSVDEASVQGMPGLVKVVVKKNFVGVVAEKPWQAIQAANKLKVDWTPGAGLPKQADFYESSAQQKPTRDTLLVDSKDVDQKLAKRRPC